MFTNLPSNWLSRNVNKTRDMRKISTKGSSSGNPKTLTMYEKKRLPTKRRSPGLKRNPNSVHTVILVLHINKRVVLLAGNLLLKDFLRNRIILNPNQRKLLSRMLKGRGSSSQNLNFRLKKQPLTLGRIRKSLLRIKIQKNKVIQKNRITKSKFSP